MSIDLVIGIFIEVLKKFRESIDRGRYRVDLLRQRVYKA